MKKKPTAKMVELTNLAFNFFDDFGHKKMKALLKLILTLWCFALLISVIACQSDEAQQPPAPFSPKIPQGALTEGHFSLAQRAVSLDKEDAIYFRQFKEMYADLFSRAVFHVPLVDQPSATAVKLADAKPSQPLALAQARLNKLNEFQISYDHISVSVDILTQFRTKLRSLKLETSNNAEPAFYLTEYRQHTIKAFEDLATLPGITDITVGLDLNHYYHLDNKAGDYNNLITLYREIYQAIKAKNAEIKVGPSFDWHLLMTQSVPAIAQEYDLDITDDAVRPRLMAYTIELTIKPFLKDNTTSYADFVGMSFNVDTTLGQELFAGNPDFKGDAEKTAKVNAFYQYIPYALDLSKSLDGSAQRLPLVINQIDWEGGSIDAKKKGDYLKLLKSAISANTIEWASWRRLLDIPENPPETSSCRIYKQNALEPDMTDLSVCYAGMLDQNGQAKTVFAEFTTNP
jgi:hypothetical protein